MLWKYLYCLQQFCLAAAYADVWCFNPRNLFHTTTTTGNHLNRQQKYKQIKTRSVKTGTPCKINIFCWCSCFLLFFFLLEQNGETLWNIKRFLNANAHTIQGRQAGRHNEIPNEWSNRRLLFFECQMITMMNDNADFL